jgi:hypothetical protein
MSLSTEDARETKQRRTTTPCDGCGGVDLISDLCDELLLRVLELLPDASDLVRTHALSRRWRGFWTRVTALRFDSDTRGEFKKDTAGRFVAFVDHVLALRATESADREPPVEHLAILLDMDEDDGEEGSELDVGHEDGGEEGSAQLMPPSVEFEVEAAQRWIHHAMQHGVKSLKLTLHLPLLLFRHEVASDDDDSIKRPVISLDGLASSAKLEAMHLELSDDVKLRLPSTAVFASLTDLSLKHIRFEQGGVHLLARFVSTACCPRLHRLELRYLKFSWTELLELFWMDQEPLLIDAAALLELSLDLDIPNLQFLELRTPSLRVLDMESCCNTLEGVRISAPRLEDIKLSGPLHIDVDGDLLSSVGRLKIDLCSHGRLHDDQNGGSIRLLECCRLTRCLEVCLRIPQVYAIKHLLRS